MKEFFGELFVSKIVVLWWFRLQNNFSHYLFFINVCCTEMEATLQFCRIQPSKSGEIHLLVLQLHFSCALSDNLCKSSVDVTDHDRYNTMHFSYHWFQVIQRRFFYNRWKMHHPKGPTPTVAPPGMVTRWRHCGVFEQLRPRGTV